MATASSFRFDWRGQSVAVQLQAAVEEAMEDTAQAAETNARNRARVDTGEMRDGIHANVERRGSSVTMVLAGDAKHTIYNEFGTSTMSAQPMIRPAIDEEAPKLAGRIRSRVAGIR